MKKVLRTFSIERKHDEFLKDNPQINGSGFVRDQFDKLMNGELELIKKEE